MIVAAFGYAYKKANDGDKHVYKVKLKKTDDSTWLQAVAVNLKKYNN